MSYLEFVLASPNIADYLFVWCFKSCSYLETVRHYMYVFSLKSGGKAVMREKVGEETPTLPRPQADRFSGK